MPVFVVPRFIEMDLLATDRARSYPLIRSQRAARPQVSMWLKRMLDLTVSLGLLLVPAPVIAVAAVLVKVTSRGPVLHTPERVGQQGRPIVIRKLRSI